MIKSRSWAFQAVIQCSASFQASSFVMAFFPNCPHRFSDERHSNGLSSVVERDGCVVCRRVAFDFCSAHHQKTWTRKASVGLAPHASSPSASDFSFYCLCWL